uniref:Uncharacterized protein n=1 Tax=Setaria viridis TaxID=4556 RepID=A0A4U6UDD0_SETVI|nr:hypothetical protein SEVIR_6G246000v2 [Setaria viridis]
MELVCCIYLILEPVWLGVILLGSFRSRGCLVPSHNEPRHNFGSHNNLGSCLVGYLLLSRHNSPLVLQLFFSPQAVKASVSIFTATDCGAPLVGTTSLLVNLN